MSPQTFSIPTGTAIIGMISAIVGLDKDEYWKYFPKDSYILSFGVQDVIKKVVIPINTLKTTQTKHFFRFEDHKRTTMEFIKDSKFRIWFAWENEELFAQLFEKLKRHESYYTVSLGLAWNLANFEFVGVFEEERLDSNGEYIDVHSIIPKRLIGEMEHLDFNNRKIFMNNIPVRMKSDNSRIVEEYDEYLFDSDGQPIKAVIDGVIKIGGDHIIPI